VAASGIAGGELGVAAGLSLETEAAGLILRVDRSEGLAEMASELLTRNES